jgi:hypothetical protein
VFNARLSSSLLFKKCVEEYGALKLSVSRWTNEEVCSGLVMVKKCIYIYVRIQGGKIESGKHFRYFSKSL